MRVRRGNARRQQTTTSAPSVATATTWMILCLAVTYAAVSSSERGTIIGFGAVTQ